MNWIILEFKVDESNIGEVFDFNFEATFFFNFSVKIIKWAAADCKGRETLSTYSMCLLEYHLSMELQILCRIAVHREILSEGLAEKVIQTQIR